MFTQLNLTDMEHKMFKKEIVKSLKKTFFEPEVTAKISKIKGIHLRGWYQLLW
jgi:hypothetical protein